MPKRVLITGASAGIGEVFARAYAKRGCDLVLTARREDRLQALADELSKAHDIEVSVISADLALPTAPKRLFEKACEDGKLIDGLINNAGYGLPGTYLDAPFEDHRDFMQVMFAAPAELVHLVLPGMKARGDGQIINVASLVSFMPGSKGHTLYGPMKSALMRFSESLNAECQGSGVNVTALCPGLTYSEFHDVNGQRPFLKSVPKLMWQSADEVVEAGIRAVEHDKPVVVTGGVNKLLATTAQLLPGPLARAAMRQQSKTFRKTPEPS